MVEITRWGVKLDSPYGKLELRFGRSNMVVLPVEDIKTSVSRRRFVELAEGVRDGDLSREELDLLRKISGLPGGWEQSGRAGKLVEAGSEEELEELRRDVISKLEEIREKRDERKRFRKVWENVEERGYHVRKYRGSKLRYLIICGKYGHSFYVIQLPPEYEFGFYRGRSSRPKTLGRRLERSPSKLLSSYSRDPVNEDEIVQELQDDEEALENLGNALDNLPEPQKSELEKRLVALKLTGEKR